MNDQRCCFCGINTKRVGGIASVSTKEIICGNCISEIVVVRFHEISKKANLSVIEVIQKS